MSAALPLPPGAYKRPAPGYAVHAGDGIRVRYLSTLYVRNHRARVGHRRGSLVVKTPDRHQRVPLEGIDGLVMLGGGQITSQALEACVKRGVRVAALRQSGTVRFVVGHKTGGNVHLRTALYGAVADTEHSLVLSRAVVAAKLQNSGRVVGRWSRDATTPATSKNLSWRAGQILARVSRLEQARTPDQVRGVEGDAARIYFRGVRELLANSELEFLTRRRRPPRDPFNSALSFWTQGDRDAAPGAPPASGPQGTSVNSGDVAGPSSPWRPSCVPAVRDVLRHGLLSHLRYRRHAWRGSG